MTLWDVLAAFVVVVVAAAVVAQTVGRVVVFEYERGLKFTKGKLKAELGPGRHRFVPFSSSVQKVDVRSRVASVPGQEVLTSDSVTMKVSIVAKFKVVNPRVAVIDVEDFTTALYSELQLALRAIIGGSPVDDLLERRGDFGPRVLETVAPKAEALGLEIDSVDLKDIMFPGPLKQAFAQVVTARKEGQAALERARGETVALRNLANAAGMLEKNPALLQLRMLQALSHNLHSALCTLHSAFSIYRLSSDSATITVPTMSPMQLIVVLPMSINR
jgi:regulator of protease activity HflC (stomatin/prohibitin superfamily)